MMKLVIVKKNIIKESAKPNKPRNTERQERGFVDLINKYASSKNPITIEYQNGWQMDNVIGAKKFDDPIESPNEPYTDIQILTTSKKETYNISMKGPSAPSDYGGGAEGIASVYPDLLPSITKQAVDQLIELGFKEGDWWIEEPKKIRELARTLLKRTFNSKDSFYQKKIILVGWEDDNPDVEFPLYSTKELKDIKKIPKTTADDYEFGSKGLPDFFGGNKKNLEVISRGEKIYIISDDLTDVEPKMKDIYFQIDHDCVEALFLGNKFMGGPIDYVYKGPMEVKGELKDSILYVNSKLLDIDDFKVKPQFLRLRRRRFDQPFAPNLKHGNLGYQVWGRGVITKKIGTRPVIIAGNPDNVLGVVNCGEGSISISEKKKIKGTNNE